jgi:hypothetical protein
MTGQTQETRGRPQSLPAEIGSDGLASGVELLDRYRLERLLGQGAMGSVWLAFDRHAGVQVAVKTLTGPALSGADQERARRNSPIPMSSRCASSRSVRTAI